MWEHMHDFAGREPGEVVLDGANLVEEPERIERGEHGSKPILHRLRDRRRREQTRTWRLRRVIPLAHARADALLLRELERRLEEVHEETRRRVHPRKRLPRRDAFEPPVPDEATDDGSVLLFDPCLIVFTIGSRAGELDASVGAVREERVVHELTTVVRVDATQWK